MCLMSEYCIYLYACLLLLFCVYHGFLFICIYIYPKSRATNDDNRCKWVRSLGLMGPGTLFVLCGVPVKS